MAQPRGPAVQAPHPPPVVIQPTSSHTYTFILLHGLSSNGDKFGRELLETGVSSEGNTLSSLFPGAKFIFPTAKWRRSSAFGRAKLTQWFNISSLNDPSQRQELQLEGFSESATYIRSIISGEMETLALEKIILGGISQGCAMSLLVLLGLKFSLCAYIGMSGWLPYRGDIDAIINCEDYDTADDPFFFSEGNESAAQDPSMQALNLVRDIQSLGEVEVGKACLSTPVFLANGAQDEKVECRLGEEAASTLSSLGMHVTWKRYPELGHWYQSPEEIDDILTFFNGKLG